MNKEQEQGFFNQIEEVLHTHEDRYELGSWEEFDANRKRSKRKWPIYRWAAAAVVLLFISFGLFEITKRDQEQQVTTVVKNIDKKSRIKDTVTPSSGVNENTTISEKPLAEKAEPIARIEEQSNPKSVLPSEPSYVAVITPPVTIATLPEKIVKTEGDIAQSENALASNIKPMDEKPVDKKLNNQGLTSSNKYTPVYAGAYDSLMNRNPVATTSTKNTNRLSYSLVVTPSVSNYKMNFGGGLEFSYALGGRLSINSGLMYTAVNGKSSEKGVMERHQVQESFLAMSGVEVPLGIQYQTNKGFYASAGLSAVGLISDNLEYSYYQDRTVSQMQVVGGVSQEIYAVISEKKTQKSIEPLSNYMGFFNFSAGKRQNIGKVNLNIGPFVKVPFSSVSTEKIKLLQGGIKIGVAF